MSMVKTLCKKLSKSSAGSEYVIAVFCDIRGFSDFSTKVESAETATFLKHFYLKLLTEYFVKSSFAKLNGDGLLMIFRHSDENLKEVSRTILETCIKAIKDFPTMFNELPLVNFKTPKALGFGIARGSASYLAKGGEKIDYSGKLLNLAARLTDLAKPQGIVVDGNYQKGIIPDHLQELFGLAQVFIRGIAEDTPAAVLYTKEWVKLPPEVFQPLTQHQWLQESRSFSVTDIKKIANNVRVVLGKKPLGKGKIRAEFEWPDPKIPGTSIVQEATEFELAHGASGDWVDVNVVKLKALVKKHKCEPATMATIRVQYVPRIETLTAI